MGIESFSFKPPWKGPPLQKEFGCPIEVSDQILKELKSSLAEEDKAVDDYTDRAFFCEMNGLEAEGAFFRELASDENQHKREILERIGKWPQTSFGTGRCHKR